VERRLTSRLSVLVLGDDHRGHANTVLDHIAAFRRFSRHDVRTFNPRGLRDARALDLGEFDVVVIHYSIFVVSDEYLCEPVRRKLRAFRGLKVQFIQDEYRWVDRISATMRDLGIGVLFTCVPPASLPSIWNEQRLPGVRKVPTLTGYVPEELVGAPFPPLRERPIDVGYRGREVPWWLGDLGQEKIRIGEGVLERAETHGLRVDIAWTEDRRIYGGDWVRFIVDCRTVLGTESGASITDFDGSIEAAVRAYRSSHPIASFDEVHRAVMAPHERNAPVIAISPRVFEAAALRTGLVMFPGHYSGAVEPDVHYIPLAKDFSNMSEVAERIRDVASLTAMVDRARRDLVDSGRYSYREFIRGFDEVIEETAVPRARPAKPGFHLARAEAALRRSAKPARMAGRTVMAASRAGLAVLVAMRMPALRRLFLAYLRRPDARVRAPLTPFLLDLLRLAVLADTVRRGGDAPFRVEARLDASTGRLAFVSRPRDGVARREPVAAPGSPYGALAEAGQLTVVQWDHSRVGGPVEFRRGPLRLSVPVGDDDRHRFRAIEALLGVLPAEVAGALAVVATSEASADDGAVTS
jgi:hypothetical protein